MQFLLGNLGTLIQSDPALTSFVAPFQTLQAAANSGNVSGLFSQTAAFFNGLASTLTQEADQQFTATLSPNEADLSPGQGQTFSLQLTSQSQAPIALTIGTGALPSGVTVRTRPDAGDPDTGPDAHDSGRDDPDDRLHEALQPGSDRHGVRRQPGGHGVRGDSTCDGRRPERDRHAGRGEPRRFGGRERLDLQHGQCVARSPGARRCPRCDRHRRQLVGEYSIQSRASATPISLDLGSISTAGLANGLYSTRVSLLTVDGVALPGRTAESSFEIGAPVSASVTQSTTSVPPGSSSVSTTVTVTDQLTTGTVAPAKFGDIQVFYSAANSFGLADNLDGAVFVIENTSGTDITNGVLSINPPGGAPDSFNVGTIPAGGRAIIEPGISDDGGTNHTFFAHTGTLLDESDQGPNSDDTSFDFKGTQGVYFLDSGNFTPAATKGPSVDDPNYILNFLGGPGDHDAPAHDFAPKVVANLFGTFQQPPRPYRRGRIRRQPASESVFPESVGRFAEYGVRWREQPQ